MTKKLKIAFDHVKKYHPTLSMVVFDKMGNWQYMDEYFKGFKFGDEINTTILEEASDSIKTLPFIYQK